MTWKHASAAAIAAVTVGLGVALHAQPPAQPAAGAADPVAAVKQSLQQGLAKARGYEWVETTVISLKGEEKARKQNRCYYGADGKVQKIAIDQPAAQEKPQAGGRTSRREAEGEGRREQEGRDAGVHEEGGRAHSLLRAARRREDPGREGGGPREARAAGRREGAHRDRGLPAARRPLTIDLDTAANRLTGLGVNSYLDKKDDTVTLAVQMNSLADGALYAAQTTLDVKAKNITVVIQNTGHRPVQK